MQAEVSPTNDLGAGILNSFVGQIVDEYEFTTHSGRASSHFGDRVRADDGGVHQYMGTDATLDLGAQDFTDFGLWKTLTEPNLITDSVTYAALSALGTVLKARRPARPTVYFGLVDHNDAAQRGHAPRSTPRRSPPPATCSSAPPAASITASDRSLVSTWEGYGAVIVTNVVLAGANA